MRWGQTTTAQKFNFFFLQVDGPAGPALWAPILCASFNAAFHVGRMSPQQRQGIICLIYKKKAKADLANWRPVTLVSKQYAVCSLCLNNRWTPHAPKVLLTDQAGFTAGRQMFWNIRKSLDAVDFARERDLDLALVAFPHEIYCHTAARR